ncbi:MAG: TonB-dependent receptor plug domain-containing protein [Pseudohongiellaceae bacterium]
MCISYSLRLAKSVMAMACLLIAGLPSALYAQEQSEAGDVISVSSSGTAPDVDTNNDADTTVTYPASYFDQYEPFSVNDMLDRIPGINSARRGGNSGQRGLGLGEGQILINGRRITGKSNEGNSQLSRIPAEDVRHIEIIRGTSGDLAVRGGGQVINVVLREAESRRAVTFELNTDRHQDGEIKPGGKISLSGQRGDFEYLLSAESEPRWENRVGFETSVLADGSGNDTVSRNNTTDSQPITFTTNFGYQFSNNDVAHFNVQLREDDSPSYEERVITDYTAVPPVASREFDSTDHSGSFWEVGGDYEHIFGSGSRWKTLFIVNRRESDSDRRRYEVGESASTLDLYLARFNRYQERIVRSSYIMDLGGSQAIEFGVERAHTILDADLKLGLLTATGDPSAALGGLPLSSSGAATVAEIRYESFAVHNWQISSRMSLESTLIVESSEIEQTGDVNKKRDFSFVRPKIDYRFDINPALQLRATMEKKVEQLSFNDFTANAEGGDDDQNTVAGNPDIRQEQAWEYDLTLEYRFPEDAGVFSAGLFYRDLEDVIERIDASTSTDINSANGNIGDGTRYGMRLDASLRLGMFNLPDVLVTSRLRVQDSSVTDPFLGIDRRLNRNGRGEFGFGFRHDLTSANRNMSYGLNYNHGFQGGRKAYDIDKIEDYNQGDFMFAFLETRGWGGFTYRFEVGNVFNTSRCRVRERYSGGVTTGIITEIEDSCSSTGVKYAIKIRGNL